MVAGGAQIVIFTTGRGTPAGNPIAPVIKITGNKATWEMMQDNIDIDVPAIMSGILLRKWARKFIRKFLRVAEWEND